MISSSEEKKKKLANMSTKEICKEQSMEVKTKKCINK